MTTSPAAASRVPAPGFANPVHDAQQTFRAVLDALARPTRAVAVPSAPYAPGSLSTGAAALLLTLADESTPLWLDPVLAAETEVTAWLAFHTGARLVADRARAAFAVVASPAALPPLDGFALGSDEAPHTSTTVIVVADDGEGPHVFTADGPGFAQAGRWAAPGLPRHFAAQWSRNRAAFPRGVDLVFAGTTTITGLPRTTTLTEAD